MAVSSEGRVSTGVAGVDAVLNGGLIPGRSYMLRGSAGAGKTILALHFLTADPDGSALFVNLEEDVDDLRANAASLGFDADEVSFLDLSPGAEVFTEDRSYDVFPAAEVEQAPVAEAIVERVEELEPDRVVLDPLTQLHYLTSDDYQFRKQAVGLMRFLGDEGATVLFTTQETADLPTEDLQFISDGTIHLVHEGDRRELRVPKFRGSGTRSGTHTFRITGEGIVAFPELDPTSTDREHDFESLPFGVPGIDRLVGGGLERGTITILSGPTGAGKTTLGTQFMKEAAGRGERSVVYLFEETVDTFMQRSRAVNIPADRMVERGTLSVERIEPLAVTPQEFATRVREEVEEEGAEIVMVDGIAGYQLTLQNETRGAVRHLHNLGQYLKGRDVATIFVDETKDITGSFRATEEQLSYLADTIVFLRHLELEGELEKAIGVLKKRTSDFERTLRKFDITAHGIEVGDPLTGLRGILGGTPTFVEDRGPPGRDGGG